MAVALDAIYGSGGFADAHFGAGTSFTASGMTVGVGASCLVVNAQWPVTVTSPTVSWNGVAMTAAAAETQVGSDNRLFFLTNPASGNLNITGSWTTSTDVYVSAISFTGTNTTTCVNTADNVATNTLTVTVTSGANDATVAAVGSSGNTVTNTNFTAWWADNSGTNWGGGSYTLGGTSNAHGFTGAGTTSGVGVHVVAPTGGGGIIPAASILPPFIDQSWYLIGDN